MRGSHYIYLLCLCSIVILQTGCSRTTVYRKYNYKWIQEEGYKWANLPNFRAHHAGFKKLSSSRTGIYFQNNLTIKDIHKNRIYLNGSGVAVGDVNGDGLPDIYFARLDGPNKLYENEGNFRFKDIADSARVADAESFSTCVVFADVDGDGDLDLIVGSIADSIKLYINDGKGHFTLEKNSGLGKSHGAMTMALADIDGDGDLDLYIANYKNASVLDKFNLMNLTWEKTVKQQYKGPNHKYTLKTPYKKYFTILKRKGKPPQRRQIGHKDELFLNDGDGVFSKVTNLKKRFLDANGDPVGLKRDWGLTAKFFDINQDGLPDLYVCNDYWTKDRIWINQGDGIFKAENPLAVRNISFASMAVDFADINRDGYWDYFTTEMLSPDHEEKLRQFIPLDPYPDSIEQSNYQPQYNRNSLYLNEGDNTFAETAYYSGLAANGWSWSPRFMDVNLDGYPDLIITTGYSYDVQDLGDQKKWRTVLKRSARKGNARKHSSYIGIYSPLKLPNKIFRNMGNLRFKDVSKKWGFDGKNVAQGLAVADLDHDGDMDLIMNRLNEKAAIYENKATAPRIAVRLIGHAPNTQAIGATVKLISGPGDPAPQMREVEEGGDYLSDSDTQLMFAANKNNPDQIFKITWPDGKRSRIDSVKANRIYEINENIIAKKPTKSDIDSRNNKTVFKDVSGKINNYQHHEDSYDDFIVQPLLPIKLSQEGPDVSWIDYNGDGYPDLFISSGRGGKLAVFKNEEDGQFTRVSLEKLTKKTLADQTAILGWRTKHGTMIVVGNANYEMADIKAPSARYYLISNEKIIMKDSIPGIFSTTGSLAAIDYNHDGTIDLFVGGRFVPTQYPVDATSRLFKNINGHFVLDKANAKLLKNIGMVTGAVFTDYNQDGWSDLLISTAWETLKLFENDHGRFHNVTKQVGLNKYKGWWNGVATGDFNNDGYPDIVATNWGKNSSYQLDTGHPLKMYYGDFDNDGRMDIIDSYYDPDLHAYVPRRQLNTYSSISNSFFGGVVDNKQFARSSVKDILGHNLNQRHIKEINTLQSMVFINERGKHFVAQPLPEQAQLSVAFDASVGDYNNDGNEDIFLSQNFFDVPPKVSRQDAGRGLLLKGDGHDQFKVIPGQISGIKVYGEQRGEAFGDFNRDGKVDLVVSQNGETIKLYENQISKAGISVQLEGPPANRDAIGSSIRLIYTDGTKGPRREIQAGSGYWSQNSSIQVMGYKASSKPIAIIVKWPNGIKEKVNIQPKKWNYVISYP
jgi:hypothetical protein